MAGIGVRLNKVFSKRSVLTNIVGFTYSTMVSVAPMFLVIGCIIVMQIVLDFASVGYAERELFSCTVLYIFIFGLLTASPFNAVLSRYMSDVIYEERYEDILPCYYIGLVINVVFSCMFGIPFCLWEHFVGGVAVGYVFTGFCGYISLVIVFYAMLYLSICKDYQKISIIFLLGLVEAFLMACLLRFVFHWAITHSMLLGLVSGFFFIAVMEHAVIKQYFVQNSGRYREVVKYFGKYWQLVLTNFFYILGLYVHNFVFWTTDMRMVVVDTFVCNQPYDMATCLAMFTNISATIIFIARVEMHFHEKYKYFSEAVIGGRGADIANTKRRMFRQLSSELMTLSRVQFIISVVVFLICMIVLPGLGFSGLTMRIYPCLAAGYFILFLMYSAMLFLYYFNDLNGALITSFSFCAVTFLVSIFATRLDEIYYGIGVVIGAFVGWCIAYFRLRWIEKHVEEHVFCKGRLIRYGHGSMPTGQVYTNRDFDKEKKDKEAGEEPQPQNFGAKVQVQ